jgi:hypothetical protein
MVSVPFDFGMFSSVEKKIEGRVANVFLAYTCTALRLVQCRRRDLKVLVSIWAKEHRPTQPACSDLLE